MRSKHTLLPVLAGALVVLLVSWASASSDIPTVSADDGTWVAFPPPSRASLAVFDSRRARTIVLTDQSVTEGVDAWALELGDSATWSRIDAIGTPPPRQQAPMSAVYDAPRDRILMFGEDTRNEIWSLNLTGTPSWTRLAYTGTPPSERSMASAFYDSLRQRMIVFGGFYFSAEGCDFQVWLNDVWELTLHATPTWRRIEPIGTPPPGRGGATLAYDAARDRLVVFGGSGCTPLRDTWSLSLGASPAWSPIVTSGTLPPRFSPRTFWDPAGDRLVALIGSELWALPEATSPQWQRLDWSGPPGTEFGPAVHDPTRRWLVQSDGIRAAAVTFPDRVWRTFPGPASPAPRTGHAAVHDARRDRLLFLDHELWELALEGTPVWKPLALGGVPPWDGQAAVWDPTGDRLVVFAYTDTGGLVNQVWTTPMEGSPSWTPLSPSGTAPIPRTHVSGVYDRAGDRLLIFGGIVEGTANPGSNETWALSLGDDPAWTLLTAAATPPPVRFDQSSVYDPIRNRMVIFGGRNGYETTSFMNDVWVMTLSGNRTWTRLTTRGTPPTPRARALTVFDAARDRMLVFGGSNDPFFGESALADVYALTFTGLTWSRLTPAFGPPAARSGNMAAYDLLRDRMVLFSGGGAADVWALTWGQPVRSTVTCPGFRSWRTGITMRFDYVIRNLHPYADEYSWSVQDQRGWLGAPATGTLAIAGSSSDTVTLSFTVPDTAASGGNVFTIRFRDFAGAVDSCSHLVRGFGQPDLLTSCPGDVENGPGTVELEYRILNDTAQPHDVEWTLASERSWPGFPITGMVPIESTYEDTIRISIVIPDSIPPGVANTLTFTSYAFDLDMTRSCTHLVTTPPASIGPGLRFVGLHPNPTKAGFEMSIALPADGPARIEVYDLRGRRVARRELGPRSAGTHQVSLPETQRLPSGVYLLRLIQGNRDATARGIVIK